MCRSVSGQLTQHHRREETRHSETSILISEEHDKSIEPPLATGFALSTNPLDAIRYREGRGLDIHDQTLAKESLCERHEESSNHRRFFTLFQVRQSLPRLPGHAKRTGTPWKTCGRALTVQQPPPLREGNFLRSLPLGTSETSLDNSSAMKGLEPIALPTQLPTDLGHGRIRSLSPRHLLTSTRTQLNTFCLTNHPRNPKRGIAPYPVLFQQRVNMHRHRINDEKNHSKSQPTFHRLSMLCLKPLVVRQHSTASSFLPVVMSMAAPLRKA